MALFTDEEKRDIREYVFGLEDDEKRTKILQCVSILENDAEDDDTLVSVMYHLASNAKEINKIHAALMNTGIVPDGAFEGEPDKKSKEG